MDRASQLLVRRRSTRNHIQGACDAQKLCRESGYSRQSHRTKALFERQILFSTVVFPSVCLFFLSIFHQARLSGWKGGPDLSRPARILVSVPGGCEDL